jgi:hypothetical protein
MKEEDDDNVGVLLGGNYNFTSQRKKIRTRVLCHKKKSDPNII